LGKNCLSKTNVKSQGSNVRLESTHMGIDGGDTKYLLPLGKLNFKNKVKQKSDAYRNFKTKFSTQLLDSTVSPLLGLISRRQRLNSHPFRNTPVGGKKEQQASCVSFALDAQCLLLLSPPDGAP
jgi:hypothetical protein